MQFSYYFTKHDKASTASERTFGHFGSKFLLPISAWLKSIFEPLASQKGKIVLWLGVLTITLACLAPPWRECLSGQPSSYSWVWISPYQLELKARKEKGANQKQAELKQAKFKVVRARMDLMKLKTTAQDLRRERFGGFSLAEAVLAEEIAKNVLSNVEKEFQTIDEKPLECWMEQPALVEVDITRLLLEVAMIIFFTGGVVLSLSVSSKH